MDTTLSAQQPQQETSEATHLWSMGVSQAQFFAGLAIQLRLQAAGILALFEGNPADHDFADYLAAHVNAASEIERMVARWPESWLERKPAASIAPKPNVNLH